MQKIKIKIPSKEYDVYLGQNSFSQLPKIISKQNFTGNILFVIDSNVKKYYSEIIASVADSIPHKIKAIVIHSSEKNKSYETVQKIHSYLIKNNFGRDSVIVAMGGGIIGDIAGFAASTYMRGIKYIQIPTTLLASVDSSVGGKTGINFENTKNIIGSFYQPDFVLIDTKFFETLPQEERLCGLGEIIKYCFLIDKRFYNYVKKNVENILNNKSSVLMKVITESIKFKGGVVEADEKESGIRKVLNLGHTFAHAFEVEQKHKLKHGQAVIVGTTCAAILSHKIGVITQKDLDEYLNFLLLFKDKIKLKDVDKSLLFEIMILDKKSRNNEIKFVLIKNIGEILTDVSTSESDITSALSETIAYFS
ncbi:MAG: 3-dehydroquinate synthase [Melioribacteraceae bacterium]|nr:3-dehydroquinate synthase [Melioribacteraceae bacterium]